jgi:hypothetical protein
MDYNDFSYSVVPDGIYSALEPCLGVANACLPVLQPVAAKMTHSRLFSYIFTTSKPRNQSGYHNDSDNYGNSELHGDLSRPYRFKRFSQSNSQDSDEIYVLAPQAPTNGEIRVTSNFKVSSHQREDAV